VKPFQQHSHRIGTPERKEAQQATNAALRALVDRISVATPPPAPPA
jgi:uncharacterized protein (DUF2267 family)